MSGPLTGEVNRAGRRLKAAGVPRAATWALAVVGECCRGHNRTGPVPIGYLAGAMHGASERSASRALSTLRDLGLVVLVRRGGGRGHGGRPAVYRLADVDQWLTDRGIPPEERSAMAAQSADDPESSRHDDGGSIGEVGGSIDADDGFEPYPPATSGGSISPDGGSIGDSPAISGRLTRHLSGGLPVVPVRDPGEAPDSPARPRPRPSPRPRARPETEGQMPLVASVPALVDEPDVPAPAGSLCGRADCRHPAPCGACGRARAAGPAPDPAQRARQALIDERERARLAEARRTARERALAAAACPLGCVGGYVGTQVCDHQPRRTGSDFAEWRELRARLPAGRASPRTAVGRGRHHATDPALAS